MSDKKKFRFRPGLPVEIEGVLSSPADAVRFDEPNKAPFWIPLSWLEEILPERTEPKCGSVEIDKDNDIWQRHSNGWRSTYPFRTPDHQDITWSHLQSSFGPTKPVEL